MVDSFTWQNVSAPNHLFCTFLFATEEGPFGAETFCQVKLSTTCLTLKNQQMPIKLALFTALLASLEFARIGYKPGKIASMASSSRFADLPEVSSSPHQPSSISVLLKQQLWFESVDTINFCMCIAKVVVKHIASKSSKNYFHGPTTLI